MRTKTFLIFLTVLGFESCNLATSKFEKNQSIDITTRKEIKTLNDKLFQGLTKNDFATVQSLMSSRLLEKLRNDSNKLIDLFSKQELENYSTLDEYSVQASASEINITLPSGNAGNNDYTFTYQSPNKDSYVSLLLLNNSNNQFLLAAIYGKYEDGWKLNILKFGPYSYFGKTAYDYFKMSMEDYKKSKLIDAVDNISLSNELLRPADTWQYLNEKEITNYSDSIFKEANAKYQLPMTLTSIETKPKVFRIFPKVNQEGFFPMVYYLTDINLKDTAALRLENEEVRKEVDSIFSGIDKDKKFVFYWAFNEMPDGKKLLDRYGFVDSLKNK